MDNKFLKWNKNPLVELYLYSIAAIVFGGVLLGMVNSMCEKGGAMCVQGAGMAVITVGILLALVVLELVFRGPFLAIKVYKNISSNNRGVSIGGIVLYIISLIATIAMVIPIVLRFI